jgi:HSP20 family molecular chaperone IbpA
MNTTENVSNEKEVQEDTRQARTAILRPAVDVFENGHSITLLADLPGVAEDALGLEVDGRTLTIQGDIHIDMPHRMESMHADVRSTRYERAFTLSNELDTDKIEASLKDGVLSVSIPKREEARPRRIEVNVD